ncbi:MAG TPA: FKBP-type peptidyl-prolyl cis-trans isomerase [Steroidobacteraceae bacterium]|jgi:FKBP-type peptidyl-prolyl cis-trans isomerase
MKLNAGTTLLKAGLAACLLMAGAAPCNSADTPEPLKLPLSKEEASYLLGVNYGIVMRNYDIVMEIDPDAVNRGFQAGLAGKKNSAADQQRLQAFISTVQPVAAQLHAAASQEFLNRNLGEKGVKVTASGLQYRILAEGDARAASPKPDDFVSVLYRGALLDGTEFDGAHAHALPVTMPLNGTLKGWQEALPLMKPGAKWQLFVPPALGYGAVPRPGIPGGSVLIFDVELVKVIPGEESKDQSGT